MGRQRYRKVPRIVSSRLFRLVRIDGRWHVIHQWSTDGGYETRPLGDTLARTISVQGEVQPLRLEAALIEAGWMPPGELERTLEQMGIGIGF